MALLAGGVAAHAQGLISMADINGIGIQVFQSQVNGVGNNTSVTFGGYSGMELIGNSGDTYTYNYSGGPKPVSFTGAPGSAGMSVELLAGPTTDTTVAALAETGTVVSTWNTGSATTSKGGFWFNAPNATIAGVAAGGNASIAIAAWVNSGSAGAATTLAEAQADGYDWGVSNLGTSAVGGGTGSPTSPAAGVLDSFSLITTVPEPSTIALGVIGASALLFRRRK